MSIDWPTVDRWLMGEAWTGSRIPEHLTVLCDEIGPRWSTSAGERRAIEYIRDQFEADGLSNAALEDFELSTWAWDRADAQVVETGQAIDLLPTIRCPSFHARAPVVDVGYGTPDEVGLARPRLKGSIALVRMGSRPFTQPIPLGNRLRAIAGAGAAAIVSVDTKIGRRIEYHSAGGVQSTANPDGSVPVVTTSSEHGSLLSRLASSGTTLDVQVETRFTDGPTANVVAEIPGTHWPEEHLVLGGHHDTVYGTPGGNDNASGTIAVMEAARVLAGLREETGCVPGRTLRFVTFSAEEQGFHGAADYVRRHGGPGLKLAINLDELSTGNIKGLVLGFPHLREMIQAHFDAMGDGLVCQVMTQIDRSSDHFPFLREGLDAAHLWRWRFHGRHAASDFHHEAADTSDKVNVRELKEYAGQLARILLRLSYVPPEEWPQNPNTKESVAARLEAERDSVVRVM